MADYSKYFPSESEKPDYTKYFPEREETGISAPVEEAKTIAPAQLTPLERAARVAGLGARAITTGLAAPSLAIGELANQGYNLGARALGGEQRPSVFQGFNTFLSNAGLPVPETPVERFSTAVTGALSGAGGQMGLARQAITAPGTTQGLLRETLLQQPGRQAVAAGTGATAATTAGELGAGPIGQTLAGLAGGMAPFAPQMVRGTPSAEALRTANTLRMGQEAGYAVPPVTGNPTITNKILEGISGKIQTAQGASFKSQAARNTDVKADLKIPKDEAITVEGLSKIRANEGKVYQDIENFGSFNTDPVFANDISRLSASQQVLSREFPELADKNVLGLVQSMNKPAFSGRTLIELTRTLREKATSAFKGGETGVGRFYRGAAEAVEEMMERNLQSAGQTNVLNNFRSARETIAKTYTAEAALNDQTGNISGRVLASQVDKGRPLTGGMARAGRFANAFPKANQDVETIGSQPGISVLDVGYGAGLGSFASMASGRPEALALAALPLIRPVTRAGILSGPYQSLMANPPALGLPTRDAAGLGILSTLRSTPQR